MRRIRRPLLLMLARPLEATLMSAKAPSDDAWASMLTLVAELQAKVATLESQMKVAQDRTEVLEQEFEEPKTDPDIAAVVRYIANRDDIAESKVC